MLMESDWESIVGSRVRALRTARGWTQAELGKRLEMHQTSIAKLEAAGRPIRVNELATLAMIFGVEPASLLKRMQTFEESQLNLAQKRLLIAERLLEEAEAQRSSALMAQQDAVARSAKARQVVETARARVEKVTRGESQATS